MFCKTIINSAKFLKMPLETQTLYFHLGLNADDDGVVEAFSTMRMLGANEDNLKVLVGKNFIRILNDDLVSFIVDWREHNSIRADRKTDSVYKPLLLKIVDESALLSPKERADNGKKDIRATNGQPKDGIGKDRLGKDRLGKDRLGKDKRTVAKVSTQNNHKNNPLFNDTEFSELWTAYIDMRIKKHKPATDKALELVLKTLTKFRLPMAKASLEESIKNSWTDVYEPKNYVKPRQLKDTMSCQ